MRLNSDSPIGLLRRRRNEVLIGEKKDVTAKAIVPLFWHATTKARTAPSFEHVPIATKLADGVSRGDSTWPEKNGWDELDLQIDDPWELLLQILKNAV